MRFTVANKTILGFVILALTILMVGIGGLRSISQLDSQIQQITDENIPQLVASYDQSLSIYQANESLLVYLTAEEPEEMAVQQKAFAKHYANFEHDIDLLTSRNQVAELDAVLQKLRDSAGQYNQYANQIKAAHEQRIALNKEATEQLQGLQAKLESVTTWVQKMSRLAEGKPDLTKAFRAISTDVNQVRVAIRQYQLNGDLERLLSEAERLRKQLATDMDKLLALEKKARLMQRHVNLVIDALLPEQGVVNAYQQLTAEQQNLAKALDKAKQQLAVTRETSAELINATDQHNMQVRTDAHDTYVTMRAVIIGLIIAALVAAVIIGTLVTTTIQRPLKQVSKRLRALGAGDLTVSFDDSRKDEFGDLAGDLNRVVSQLHEVMQLIIDKSGELAGTAKDNTQISHETTDAMQRQGKQLASTSSTANELELSVGEVASHVKATLTALQDCRALTESASQHVNNTSGSITGQANEIAVAVEMSEQLEVSSKEIDNILDTINSIAGQTNLLALNAAIEAARAGSHGRGFAVVADEVRALASRTHHSTEEIQQMVETMQDQIKKVAERLRNSQSQASSCVELSTASTAALGELELSINRIADMSEQIREATDRQNSSVDSVSQHLVEINQVAQSTAQSAELSASRGDELLEIAESQRQLTQRFTL